MTNRSKALGTKAESAVVRYLRDNGFAHAERRALHGSADLGDVTGTPGICWEIKGGEAARSASDGQVRAWLQETTIETLNAGADLGILVRQQWRKTPAQWVATVTIADLLTLYGLSAADRMCAEADGSPVHMSLANLVAILRHNGYGDPIDQEPPR